MLEGVTSIYYSIFNLSKIPPPPTYNILSPNSNQDFLDFKKYDSYSGENRKS